MVDKSVKRLNVWLPLLFAAVTAIGILVGARLNPNVGNPLQEMRARESGKAMGVGTIEEIIRFVEAKYVDEVDRELLVTNAIEDLLKQLDPHSSYIPAKELALSNSEIRGSYTGIGINYLFDNDTITVVDVLKGGPADKAGIQRFDKILYVGKTLIAGKDIEREQILNLIRGERNTKVSLSIKRIGEPELLVKSVTRDDIYLSSISAAYRVDESTGYIRIARFRARAFDDFLHALEKMIEQEKVKNLIIDVRGNPGGYLQEVVKILNQLFSEKGKLLVYTEGRHNSKSEYKTTGRAFYDIGKIVVLIDERSASASEILAGAIQDWDRGVIIGRRSYGKGLVQEQYYLSDGSAIRLTVAKYYTPSGRCIQKSYDSGSEDYEEELSNRFSHNELYDRNSIVLDDTAKYYTAGNRVVYGGGGIIPDIFIPFDSVRANECFVFGEEQFESFALTYAEKHRDELNKYNSQTYIKDFQMSNDDLREFYEFCQINVFVKDRARHKKQKGLVSEAVANAFKKNLKIKLGYLLFGESVETEISNINDPVFIKALEVMNSGRGVLSFSDS